MTEFFKNKKAKVKPEALSKLVGNYTKDESVVEIIFKEDKLIAKMGDYEELFDPYNELESEGEYLKAARFVLLSDGKVEKLVILTSGDNIVELVYQEPESK